MEPVRRDDGELEGFVLQDGSGWLALTVFHGTLGRGPSRETAIDLVHRRGLQSLAERWHWYSRHTGAWRVVLPQECRPGWVRVALGYYSLPGVETTVLTSSDLAGGDRLTLLAPDRDEAR